jgi:beta-xylosidase
MHAIGSIARGGSHTAARILMRVLLALILLGTNAPDALDAHAQAEYRNPVFASDFPDPMVLRVGSIYYAYGTTTNWEPLGHLFPILSSVDLVHWRYIGDARSEQPSWGDGDWWAPDVIARDGLFYLFYVGKSLTTGLHCIGVATARSPRGPFIDHGILSCGDAHGQGYIDPDPFVAPNGKAYLYVSVDSPYHSISVLPLTADLLHIAGARKELFTLSQPWEYGRYFSTVEGPFMVLHHSIYYLFYSGNDWQHNYAMGYATATAPLGPFTKYAHNPVLRGTSAVIGPGGGSLIQVPRHGWWLVYHAWSGGPGYGNGGVRTLRIDPVSWAGRTVHVNGPSTTPRLAP